MAIEPLSCLVCPLVSWVSVARFTPLTPVNCPVFHVSQSWSPHGSEVFLSSQVARRGCLGPYLISLAVIGSQLLVIAPASPLTRIAKLAEPSQTCQDDPLCPVLALFSRRLQGRLSPIVPRISSAAVPPQETGDGRLSSPRGNVQRGVSVRERRVHIGALLEKSLQRVGVAEFCGDEYGRVSELVALLGVRALSDQLHDDLSELFPRRDGQGSVSARVLHVGVCPVLQEKVN